MTLTLVDPLPPADVRECTYAKVYGVQRMVTARSDAWSYRLVLPYNGPPDEDDDDPCVEVTYHRTGQVRVLGTLDIGEALEWTANGALDDLRGEALHDVAAEFLLPAQRAVAVKALHEFDLIHADCVCGGLLTLGQQGRTWTHVDVCASCLHAPWFSCHGTAERRRLHRMCHRPEPVQCDHALCRKGSDYHATRACGRGEVCCGNHDCDTAMPAEEACCPGRPARRGGVPDRPDAPGFRAPLRAGWGAHRQPVGAGPQTSAPPGRRVTAGWGPRRTPVRRGDPAVVVPGHTPVPTAGYGTCGHLIAVHNISPTTGRRTACTHMGPEGQCPCRGCEPAAEATS